MSEASGGVYPRRTGPPGLSRRLAVFAGRRYSSGMLDRLESAYQTALAALLAERHPDGYWVGELSTSALSTATAVMALHQVQRHSSAALLPPLSPVLGGEGLGVRGP